MLRLKLDQNGSGAEEVTMGNFIFGAIYFIFGAMYFIFGAI